MSSGPKIVLAALALGLALPASGQDAETIRLLQDVEVLDSNCRGGPGDSTDTWMACGARDYASWLLSQRGYCYGKDGQIGADMEWHVCEAGSLDASKPEFALPY